jgi:hypothetical protein
VNWEVTWQKPEVSRSVTPCLLLPCDRLPHRPFQHSTNYCAAALLRKNLLICMNESDGFDDIENGGDVTEKMTRDQDQHAM